jgi:hypothetical protein
VSSLSLQVALAFAGVLASSLFFSCHPSPQAEDLLLSLVCFPPHSQKLVISTEAVHRLILKNVVEKSLLAFPFHRSFAN